MNKILLGLVFSALASTVISPVSANEAEYLDMCKSYAKDDGVSRDEMDDYLQACVQDLKSAEAEKKN